MEFKTFVRRPFQVQAVEITDENMAEIAEMIGGKIKDFESESGETGGRYIQLNRQIIPNVGKALIGWWVTVLGDNFRCYAPKVFADQFNEIVLDSVLTNGQSNSISSEDAGLHLVNDNVDNRVDVV